MKETPDWPYRCVKTNLKSVVKNNLVIEKLSDAALRANSIMIHTLQLLKLYLLHCCEKGDKLPTLDRQFVTSVMKVLCKPPSTGRAPKLETQIIKDKLKAFYEQHYKAYVSEELCYGHMSTVLNYLSTDVITMYENNIKQHYVEYVERYVSVSWRKKELVVVIRKSGRNTRSRQDALCARLRSVKDDLVRPHSASRRNGVSKATTRPRATSSSAKFEELFGSGAETIVAIGDWNQRQHRRFTKPVKGKGFRTMFRKAGYDVYLVDEFCTSCRCSACKQGECKTFRVCETPRPYRSGSILFHGLVRCKSCSRLWSRDMNAASNIWKVATSAIRGEGRLAYLQRARGSISGATSVGNELLGCLSTLPRNHDLH